MIDREQLRQTLLNNLKKTFESYMAEKQRYYGQFFITDKGGIGMRSGHCELTKHMSVTHEEFKRAYELYQQYMDLIEIEATDDEIQSLIIDNGAYSL